MSINSYESILTTLERFVGRRVRVEIGALTEESLPLSAFSGLLRRCDDEFLDDVRRHYSGDFAAFFVDGGQASNDMPYVVLYAEHVGTLPEIPQDHEGRELGVGWAAGDTLIYVSNLKD
jgi:hypothetical protein